MAASHSRCCLYKGSLGSCGRIDILSGPPKGRRPSPDRHALDRALGQAASLGLPPRMGELLAKGNVGHHAAVAFLGIAGRTRSHRKVRTLIRRHRQALRADTECWGTASFALLAVERRRDVLEWMSDWPQRTDAKPWMLLNLVYALRAERHDRVAGKVSRALLQLPPDHCTAYHVLWLALDDLLDGDGQGARSRLEGLDLSASIRRRATFTAWQDCSWSSRTPDPMFLLASVKASRDRQPWDGHFHSRVTLTVPSSKSTAAP